MYTKNGSQFLSSVAVAFFLCPKGLSDEIKSEGDREEKERDNPRPDSDTTIYIDMPISTPPRRDAAESLDDVVSPV